MAWHSDWYWRFQHHVGRDLLPLVRVLSRLLGYRTWSSTCSVPQVRDDLMIWMQFIIPGWLHPGNLESFAYCLERLPSNAPIIEIGTFAGLSLNHLILLLCRAGRRNSVFSVDEWRFESVDEDAWKFEGAHNGLIKGSNISHDAYRAHVMETFRRNVTLFSGDRLPHHIELNSDAFFAAWGGSEQKVDFFGNVVQLGGPIAFAYIDGEHTYEQSTKDFQNVDRYLEQGGFIIFDDSADYGQRGSTRTAQEAAMSEHYELVAKNPNYCLRKR